jgi:hypothetical protein
LADAHCNLGTALHDQGKHDEAVAAYGQAIGLNPGLAAAYYNLGSARYDQGELDEAMAARRPPRWGFLLAARGRIRGTKAYGISARERSDLTPA